MSKTIRFAIVIGLFVMLLVLELVRWNLEYRYTGASISAKFRGSREGPVPDEHSYDLAVRRAHDSN